MNRPKIIIAGGSGFLGRSLARTLNAQEYEVVILSRTPLPEDVPARWVKWDGKTVAPEWARELEGARAVVNLTGKNVNCRYTEAARKEIDESRVDSVWAVAAAINACEKAPEVWVQAGSLAIYGDGGETKCDETTAPGQGIPVETCLKWEQAFTDAPTPRTRKVLYRISFVLGHGGGALQMLVNLTRCFLGGAIGNGRQYISWIHEEDMNRLWQRAMKDPAMSGTYNATSNDPVPNATFMKELRRALRRPWTPPLPAWLVPLGCWVLRTEPVLALTGRRGVPARLLAEGFQFHHPELRPALTQLFRQG